MKIPDFWAEQYVLAVVLYACCEDISCDNYLFDITYVNLLFISLVHTTLEVMRKIDPFMLLILIVNQLYIRRTQLVSYVLWCIVGPLLILDYRWTWKPHGMLTYKIVGGYRSHTTSWIAILAEDKETTRNVEWRYYGGCRSRIECLITRFSTMMFVSIVTKSHILAGQGFLSVEFFYSTLLARVC